MLAQKEAPKANIGTGLGQGPHRRKRLMNDENWEMSFLLLSAQGEPTTGGCQQSSIPAVRLLGIPQDDMAGQGASGAGAGFLLEAFGDDLGDVPQGDRAIALGLFQEVSEVFGDLRFGFVHSLLMEFSI